MLSYFKDIIGLFQEKNGHIKEVLTETFSSRIKKMKSTNFFLKYNDSIYQYVLQTN